jgi:hypothetical protein
MYSGSGIGVGTGMGVADAATGGSLDDGSGVDGATDVFAVGDGAALVGAHAARRTTRPSASDLIALEITPVAATWESELAGPKH